MKMLPLVMALIALSPFVSPLPAAAATCGDAVLDPGEACDDGSTNIGDGCSDVCAVEPGYACVNQPTTVCAVDGAPWSPINLGLGDPPFNTYQLEFDANGALHAATESGIFRFDGVSWSLVGGANDPLGVNFFTTLAFDSNNTLYAGTLSSGVFSFDGASWIAVGGVNNNLNGNTIRAVIVGANDALYTATQSLGIFQYDGVSWNALNNGLTNLTVFGLKFDATGALYAAIWDQGNGDGGVYRFDGSSWSPVGGAGNLLSTNYPLAMAFDADNVLYAGTLWNPGVYRFDGVSWNAINSGLGAAGNVYSLVFDLNGVLHTGTQSGVFQFDGSSWAPLGGANNLLQYAGIFGLAIDSHNALYAADFNFQNGVFRVNVCGDGAAKANEACDDGNTTTETCGYGQISCTVCASDCTLQTGAASFCGDGITDGGNGETCDDGNVNDTDACKNDCTITVSTGGSSDPVGTTPDPGASPTDPGVSPSDPGVSPTDAPEEGEPAEGGSVTSGGGCSLVR